MTVYTPTGPEHESVETAEGPRTMLVLESPHERPGGLIVSVRLTVPANPLTGATVIAELSDVPAAVIRLVGLAGTEKSVKVKVSVTELVTEPSTPVTVTRNVWGRAEEHERVTLPLGRGTPVFENVQVTPALGELLSDRLTVPVNPPDEVIVSVENGFELTALVRLDGLAVIEKERGTLVTNTLTTVVFVIAPFVPPTPLIVTV